MNIVVTTRQIVKPTCPSPDHLQHLQLSSLDQFQPRVFSSFIYFYSSSDSAGLGVDVGANLLARCDMLKKSLAETLTGFYPLAGRLKDDLQIHCNGEGVHYVEAQANCQLSQVVHDQPNYAEINNLLPYPDMEDSGDMLLAIQVNIFDCGGMAIVLSFSRKFMDGLSMFMFVNSWAAATRGDRGSMVFPKFDLATLFPLRDMSGRGGLITGEEEKKKLYSAKCFVFTASAVSALRAKYGAANAHLHPRPSRVEALSAFIWSRFMVATQGDKAGQVGKCYRVIQAVNLRPRANPPLPESCFGNLSRFALIIPTMEGTAEDGYGLVTQMRDAIRKIDGNYVKQLQDNVDEKITKAVGIIGSFTFTSVSRYSIYEADFGWGRPMWVTMAAQPVGNVVIFMPNRSGDGMQAVINMKSDDLAKLEADKEFLSFVSPTLDDEVLFRSSL